MKSKVEDFFQKNADVIGGRKKSAKPKPQTPLKKLNPLTDTPSFRYRGVNRPKRPPDLPRQPTLPDIADRDHSAKSGHHKTQLERTHTQLSHGRGTLTRIAETEETSHGESLPDISGAKTTTAKQTGSNKKVHTLVLPPIKTGKTSDHDGHNSSADQWKCRTIWSSWSLMSGLCNVVERKIIGDLPCNWLDQRYTSSVLGVLNKFSRLVWRSKARYMKLCTYTFEYINSRYARIRFSTICPWPWNDLWK